MRAGGEEDALHGGVGETRQKVHISGKLIRE